MIEDHPNEREMLDGFLRLQGYQIATATNGHEALDYLESNEMPRIALVDMGLPQMDGATTIRRIRENIAFDDLKIYGLSGQTISESGLSFTNDRIDGWFMKPLDPESLVHMLAESDVEATTVG